MHLLILILLSIAAAVLYHVKLPTVFVPSVAAGLTAAVSYHLIGYLIDGGLDSLFIISMMTAFLMALPISIAVGLLMRSSGRKPKARVPPVS